MARTRKGIGRWEQPAAGGPGPAPGVGSWADRAPVLRQRPAPPAEWADDASVLVAGGYAPTGPTRRAAARAARHLADQHRKAVLATRHAGQLAERRARRDQPYLPAHGEPGAASGRPVRDLRIPSHRATSEMLAGAYPFLAEAGLGAAGMVVGEDAWSGGMFCYDPWECYRRGIITNPNITVTGQIGRGKSTLTKSLATRTVAFGRSVYVPGDPKGEWTPVTRAVGGQVIDLGQGRPTRLNPLDEGLRPQQVDPATWRRQVTGRRLGLLTALTEATMGRPLAPTERTALAAALTSAQREHSVPILPHVVDALLDPVTAVAGSTLGQLREDGRKPGHALKRLVDGDLAGLFDGPSTAAFDATAPMLSLDLSGVSGSDMLLGLVMTCASTWMEAALADPAGGQRLVVYDEAWRILAQPALLARMQAQWKLSRAWGLANVMVIHRLSDLDAVGDAGSQSRGLAQGLLADTGTRILYHQPADEAAAAGRLLGLSATEVNELSNLDKGEGLWRIGERAFIVRHRATPGELAVYDTDVRMSGRAAAAHVGQPPPAGPVATGTLPPPLRRYPTGNRPHLRSPAPTSPVEPSPGQGDGDRSTATVPATAAGIRTFRRYPTLLAASTGAPPAATATGGAPPARINGDDRGHRPPLVFRRYPTPSSPPPPTIRLPVDGGRGVDATSEWVGCYGEHPPI